MLCVCVFFVVLSRCAFVVVFACAKASNKEAMTCSWETSWRWPSKSVNKGLGFDVLPDLKVFLLLFGSEHT